MIFASKAANVLLARCRARYGQRLTARDIDALTGCRTVADCAACLKNTRYADCLSDMGERIMRRGAFEAALDRHLLGELYGLCRCEQSVGDWFADYLLMQSEIRLIMSVVLRLSSGRMQSPQGKIDMPARLHTGIDTERLSTCTDYDDLLEAVRHSRFIKVLRALRPLPGNLPDSALIEHSLYAAFYDKVAELIDHHSGSARDELTELISAQIDMANFRHVYRLKKYYAADEAAVRSMLLGQKSVTGSRVMRRMTAAPDAEAVLKIFLEDTPYGRHIDREVLAREGGLEAATRLLVLNRARRLMHFSVHPSTVLLAYIIMAEAEVHDLTTIVEGVYYGLPREEILSLITINELAG